ncbi:acetylglutamate kinase [Fulvivirgaceae bacterium BMA12]|uniref:Acetylglutamate kinase n=1 Tax=Agaribacillus aureus TaxID=3051825 RepID=A0ABT8L816_9BACT|nr:acetylglutamate kinase [Fulvivirgaceae bacterium BMA12]
MKSLKVIKVGGNVIDNEQNLSNFIDNFVQVKGPKILVHGGGKKASAMSRQMGVAPKMLQGRRVTDQETLEIVTMVYAGLINKNLVARLQSKQCNALGLTGADGNTIQAVKRPVKAVDYGFVGDLDHQSVNSQLLDTLLNDNICPVICAITHDKKGQLLNTNADTIATNLAIAMQNLYETSLIFCFEKSGVLRDPEDEKSYFPNISWQQYQQYKSEQIIKDGMIPKLDNAFEAIGAGVASIVIKHARNLNNDIGTTLYK